MPPRETRSPAPEPTAGMAALRLRARLLERIRSFFRARGVLEVETPLLARATTTDPHIASMEVHAAIGSRGERHRLFLQTSPEFAMKRLLAAGSGAIFQICKAFRDAEQGRLHHPEFTLVEWYRPGFALPELMDELEALLAELLGTGRAARIPYADALRRWAGVDVARASLAGLHRRAEALGLTGQSASSADRDLCLDLIFSHAVQKNMSPGPVFVYDYPETQASLARIRPGNPPLAERFELFLNGIELANGFRELTDAGEQRRRFQRDLEARSRVGSPAIPIDERLLAALEAGLPDCSGVALGFDRMAMIAAGRGSLAEVLSFTIDRA